MNDLLQPDVFPSLLYERMVQVNPGIDELELYEFRYALDNLYPGREGAPPAQDPAVAGSGWASVTLDSPADVEARIGSADFYNAIQIKPRVGDRIVLDPAIERLTNMLFVGLVTGAYEVEWVRAHFYFDIRGFIFLTRTHYFTPEVLAHLGGAPLFTFEPRQRNFDRSQSIGYRAFREANAEVDQAFIQAVHRLVEAKGTPIVLAVAGPTAAGKTEIVERLRLSFQQAGRQVTSIEMDNFLTDRDYREQMGIHTLGQQAIHYELFIAGLEAICRGETIRIPCYDFVYATSSHDLAGQLKPGGVPIEVEPADIIFIEGNFPFLLEEAAQRIGIKAVYLADDPIRMKRKWKRDIDYRKKYEPTYFRNRYFRNQFLMAEKCYRPQMRLCDLLVDTTGAALWTRPEIARIVC